jgi:hypothetical protein
LQPIKFGVGVLENKRTKEQKEKELSCKMQKYIQKLVYEKKNEMNDEKGTKL